MSTFNEIGAFLHKDRRELAKRSNTPGRQRQWLLNKLPHQVHNELLQSYQSDASLKVLDIVIQIALSVTRKVSQKKMKEFLDILPPPGNSSICQIIIEILKGYHVKLIFDD